MHITETMIWSFVDGSCSENERRLLEKAIREDDGLRIRVEETKRLQLELAALDTDVPSLGFTRSVMERIALLPQFQTALLDRRQKRMMTLLLLASALLPLLVGVLVPATGSAGTRSIPFVREFVQMAAEVPTQLWVMVASISLSAWALVGLDRWLDARKRAGIN